MAAGAIVISVVLATAVFGDGSATSGSGSGSPTDPGTQLSDTPGCRSEDAVGTPTDLATTTTEAVDDVSARAELDRQVASDRSDVEALVGQWIPQLSAKQPGLVVNGTTFDHLAVLRDFHALRARYPEVLLLYSGEYSGYRFGDF